MGMHVGLIGAHCEWPALHEALEVHCGDLEDQGAIAAEQWLDLPAGQDLFHVASVGGRTYVLDPAMVLSSNQDVIVSLGSQLGTLAVGGGGETVSGTFWFTAADSTGAQRVHFEVAATLTEPFDLGAQLPSEARVPWNDIDGNGILARFSDLGFEPTVFTRGAEGRRVLWVGDRFPGSAELGAQIAEHCERFKRADGDDWMKNIKVQVREGGGYDLHASPSNGKPSRRRGLFRRRG